MLEGDRGRGRQLKKACPCSWKGESPKRFHKTSRHHRDQSKPFWFQKFSGSWWPALLRQAAAFKKKNKKTKPQQFTRLQTAKWTPWEKSGLALSPSHSLPVDYPSPGTTGEPPAQHSPALVDKGHAPLKKLKLLTLIPWRDWEALPFLTFWLHESRWVCGCAINKIYLP